MSVKAFTARAGRWFNFCVKQKWNYHLSDQNNPATAGICQGIVSIGLHSHAINGNSPTGSHTEKMLIIHWQTINQISFHFQHS